jgi:hypothetical protein
MYYIYTVTGENAVYCETSSHLTRKQHTTWLDQEDISVITGWLLTENCKFDISLLKEIENQSHRTYRILY